MRPSRPAWLGLVALAFTSVVASAPVLAQTARSDFWITNGIVQAMARSGNTLYIAGDFTKVGPASGGGIPLDASTGTPQTGFPQVAGRVQVAIPDGSGGWYIGGGFDHVGGQLHRC